jgi:hypothetical protein
MTMPQYTAEAALYKSDRYYSQFSLLAASLGQSVVQAFPAILRVDYPLPVSVGQSMPSRFHTPCDAEACFSRANRDYNACLWRCPAIEFGYEPPSPEAAAACRNSCEASYSRNILACDFVGCEAGLSCCAGTCVDASSDLSNCGACSNRCDDGVRVNPKCCGGVCTDVSNDAENCSSCGVDCSTIRSLPPHSGAICTRGMCDFKCNPGFTPCGHDCADFMADMNHCGSCGTVCQPPQTCQGGKCLCSDGKPLNLSSNCGACDKTCPENQICNGVGCECRHGLSWCGGDPSRGSDGLPGCYDQQTDNLHCGSCDIWCARGVPCVNGNCDTSCAAKGLTDCGSGICVDTKTDPYNCGKCGQTCGAFQSCQNSQCTCSMKCGSNCCNPISQTCDTGSNQCVCASGFEACGTGCCLQGECCDHQVCMDSPEDICCNNPQHRGAFCQKDQVCCSDGSCADSQELC